MTNFCLTDERLFYDIKTRRCFCAELTTNGKGGDHLACKSLLAQKRDIARVVDVGMGQKHIVDLRRRHREFLILIQIRSLLHAAVNENPFPAGFQKVAAACHLVGRADKSKFHIPQPLFLFIVSFYSGCGYEYFTISLFSLCMIFFSSRDI